MLKSYFTRLPCLSFVRYLLGHSHAIPVGAAFFRVPENLPSIASILLGPLANIFPLSFLMMIFQTIIYPQKIVK